eukprot:295584_1
MTTSSFNHDITVLCLCVAYTILLYLSLIFTIPQLKRFIQCLLVKSELTETDLYSFAQNRHPILSIIYLSLLVSALYIIYPLVLILSVSNPSSNTLYIATITDLLLFLSLVSRMLALTLHQHLINTQSNWIWRREINAKERDALFLKHASLFRSTGLILFYVSFTLMSFTILIVLLHLQTTYFGFIYPAIILTLLLLTFYIIRSKISVVTDPHYIRTELLYTIESSGTLYAISCIVYMLVPSKYLLLPHILCTSMGHGFAIYFACGWAIKRLKLLQSPHNLTSEVTHSAFVSAFHDHKTICFDDIVSHRIGIESFCAHLAEEYSLDSMLFIIESCQFKAILHALHSNVALSDNKEE